MVDEPKTTDLDLRRLVNLQELEVNRLTEELDRVTKLCDRQQGDLDRQREELVRLRAVEVAYNNLTSFKIRFLEKMFEFIHNEPFPRP